MLERNRNEVSRPVWMDDNYFVKMLQTKHGLDAAIQVEDVRVYTEGNQAENIDYTCYKVVIKYLLNSEANEESLVIKTLPTNSTGKDIAVRYDTFNIETTVYADFLSKIETMLAGIDMPTKISPFFYGAIKEPEIILCFEDVSSSKYMPFTRQPQFNLDHCLQTLKKMAMVHACSVILAEKNPELKKFCNTDAISMNDDRQISGSFAKLALRDLGAEVKEWPGYNAVADKLFFMADNFSTKCGSECYSAKPEEFNVLVHNNLMTKTVYTKYNKEEDLEDVILHDFRFSYWGSPAIDLNFLLFSSVLEGIRRVHFKFIIQEYHKVLYSVLTKLGYTKRIPSLRDIHIDLLKTSTIALLGAVCVAPQVIENSREEQNFELLSQHSPQGIEYRLENFKNPVYKCFIQKVLKEFYCMGFLDL